jgi:hypothetical protein
MAIHHRRRASTGFTALGLPAPFVAVVVPSTVPSSRNSNPREYSTPLPLQKI